MKNRVTIFILIIGVTVLASLLFAGMNRKNQESFETRRRRTLHYLDTAIKQAEAEGKYECCIEPPCTMCYLGNWVWEDGTCSCDRMIAEGEWDKVCPQCIRGIEQGRCNSEPGSCPVL